MISVCIPTYNVDVYIEKAVESVLNQTSLDYEIIIVDDNSSDCTFELLKNKYKDNPRITIYRLKEHKGVSYSRNKCIELARGEYITFLDADDYYINRNLFSFIFKELTKNNPDLIIFNFCIYNNKKREIEKNPWFDLNYEIINCNHIDSFASQCFGNYGNNVWNKIFKTNIIKDNNIIFDTRLSFAEDKLFILKYSLFVKKMISLKYIGVAYRRNHTSLSNGLIDEINLKAQSNIFIKEIEKFNSLLPLSIFYPFYFNNVFINKHFCSAKNYFKQKRFCLSLINLNDKKLIYKFLKQAKLSNDDYLFAMSCFNIKYFVIIFGKYIINKICFLKSKIKKSQK